METFADLEPIPLYGLDTLNTTVEDLLPCECDPNEKQRALFQVYEAIKGLPREVTKDYRTALALAAPVATAEAHPLRFLRCCQGDPWSAAARLCQNWSFRRQIFGERYWLRPMRLRRGALTTEDVDLLRMGAFALLTPPPTAADQRQVMVVNFGRVQGGDMGVWRKRVIMYLFLTSLNEYSQRHGIHVLLVIDGTGIKVSSDNGSMFGTTNTLSATTLHQVILVNDPNETRLTLSHLFGFMMRRLVEKFWGKEGRLLNIAERTPELTLQALMAQGLHPSTIPTQLGGTFSYERNFRLWLAERLVEEETAGRETVSSQPMVSSLPKAMPPAVVGMEITPSSSLNGNEPQIMDDFMHFSPIPTTFHQFTQGIAAESNNHQMAWNNNQLPQGNMRTSHYGNHSLYNQESTVAAGAAAPTNVAQSVTFTENVERPPSANSGTRQLSKREVRKRNCEYSKKHYYKKKNQAKELSDQCDALRKTRDRLNAEQGRLTVLLQQAQNIVQTPT